MNTIEDPQRLDPSYWHRRLCPINDWLYLCGDLPADPASAVRQLREWTDAGITDILDVRIEWNDERLVHDHAEGVRYHWLGADDTGGDQSDEWYETGIEIAARVRALDGRLVVHCHMGVNRAPSMAFRLLLVDGYRPVDALRCIRKARPIAAAIYADSALDHHHRTTGTRPWTALREHWDLAWFMENDPVDIGWVTSRIRAST